MQPEEIDQYPEGITKKVMMSSGNTVCLRPLTSGDARILGDYFLGLSKATRALYGPHPFNQATADQICAGVNSDDTLRMLATTGQEGQERIIAYFIVTLSIRGSERERYEALGIPLDTEKDCTLAPSVADDYQNTGLGSLLMSHLNEVLRLCGRKRMVLQGGTTAHNKRAIHFYEKFGFRKVGEFITSVNNFDMIADL